MNYKLLNINGLSTLLNQLKQKFSTKAEVSQVEADTDTYVLNIDYENTLAFNTFEIVVSENDNIILEENESLISTMSDEILIDANNAYIIIEKGE